MFELNKTCVKLDICLFHIYNVPVELRKIIMNYARFDYKDPRLIDYEKVVFKKDNYAHDKFMIICIQFKRDIRNIFELYKTTKKGKEIIRLDNNLWMHFGNLRIYEQKYVYFTYNINSYKFYVQRPYGKYNKYVVKKIICDIIDQIEKLPLFDKEYFSIEWFDAPGRY
jgi:hypothetical protein